VAEQLIYGEASLNTGASDDIRQATNMARRMVTEFGMSQKLGPLRYSENEEEVFLGHSVTQRKNISDDTARLIDEEIRRIVEAGEKKAREILTRNIDNLKAVTKALFDYETLTGEEVRAIIRGEPITRPSHDAPPPESGGRSAVPPTRIRPQRGGGAPGMEPEPQPGT
jgi:cell division protease FtsH